MGVLPAGGVTIASLIASQQPTPAPCLLLLLEGVSKIKYKKNIWQIGNNENNLSLGVTLKISGFRCCASSIRISLIQESGQNRFMCTILHGHVTQVGEPRDGAWFYLLCLPEVYGAGLC